MDGRGTLRFVVALAGIAAATWAAVAVRADPSRWTATSILLIGCAAAGVAVSGSQPRWRVDTRDLPCVEGVRPRWLALLGLVLIIGASASLTLAWGPLFGLAVILMAGGVTVLSLSIAGGDRAGRVAGIPWRAGEVAGLLGILLVACTLRFYRFTEFPDPYGIFAIEEPQTAMGGAYILHGYRPWEFVLDHYVAALGLWVGGPTLPAVRAPFAAASALTVLPLYLLLRQLVSVRAAMFGTFLLAASSWHLMYARCAHNIFLGTLVVVLILALLVHVERTHRLSAYPWIGLLTGCTLFGYAGYRGTLLFVGLFVLWAAWLHWRDGRTRAAGAAQALRRDLAGAALVAFVIVTLIPPLAVRLAYDPHPNYSYFEAAKRSLANREYYTSDVGAFLRQRIERAREALGLFLHTGDESPTFNAPGKPMLDPITGVFFVSGLLYAACSKRRLYHRFFVVMAVALFFGGTVLVQNLDVRRLQGLIPLICIFAALFADALLVAASVCGRGARFLASLLLILASVAVIGWSVHVFFFEMADDPEVRQAFHNEYLSLVELGRSTTRGRYNVVLTDAYNFFGENDYKWMIEGQMEGTMLADLLEIMTPGSLPEVGQPVSVVLAPPFEDPAVPDFLRCVFPGAICRAHVTRDAPRLTMSVCDLPGVPPLPAVPWQGGLTARYFWSGREGTILERTEPFIAYGLVPQVCRTSVESPEVDTCTVEWSGTFEIAELTVARLLPEARGGTLAVEIDGGPAGAVVRLEPGTHRLRATAVFKREAPTGAQLRWELPGEPQRLMPFFQG
jgi:hypothetical protein